MKNQKMRILYTLPLAGALAAACGGGHVAREATGQPIDVQVAAATVQHVARPFETGGVVRARTTATLVSRIVAEVQEVLVRPGDRVRAGQLLIRLDARDLQANKARAEAGLVVAEQGIRAAATARQGAEAGLTLAAATHKRIAELHAKNSATAHELDQAVGGLRGAEAQAQGAQAAVGQAEAGAEAARAAVKAANVALSWAAITAPFDGIVTEKLVEPGNMAAPGVPLMTVEDARGFRLDVKVDEARAAAIDRSRPVAVVLEPGGVEPGTRTPTVVGTISEFSRALDPGSHAFLVKIELPANAAPRSGMFGRARFAAAGGQDTLLVPTSAIIRRGQVTSVFVAGADNRAALRLVQLGASFDAGEEVVAGLDAGERVVVNPPPVLVDGALVREARR